MDRLGAGGMAVVHRARDEWLKRDVAIKVIWQRMRQDMLAVRRFRREAQLGARLVHPNIVAVLDAGAEPHDFIVMELVRGRDAGRLLKERHRPHLAAALRVLVQISDALQYTHDRGLIHGDVTPRNVVVREDDGTAKLADFGLAQPFQDVVVNRPGHALGTPGYMAPELLEGAAPTPRADLYSLAAAAHALLTGRLSTSMGDARATKSTTSAVPGPEPLASFGPDLPHGVADAIRQGLSHDPAARQASVAEFGAQVAGHRIAPALLQAAA
jgi:serine/threonine-protein kinase